MNRLQKQMRSESPICHSQLRFFFRKNPRGQRSHRLFRATPQAPSRWTFRCRLCQSRSNPLVNLNQFRPRLLWSRSPWRHFRKPPLRSLHCSTVIPEAPPAPEPVSTEHHEIPITLFQTAAAPPLSAAPSDAPSASPASMDTLSHWSTGEVEVQPHRPSEKKRNWDKEKGEAPVVPPAPLPLVEESPEVVAELSRSGGWESAPSEAVAPVVEAGGPRRGKGCSSGRYETGMGSGE